MFNKLQLNKSYNNIIYNNQRCILVCNTKRYTNNTRMNKCFATVHHQNCIISHWIKAPSATAPSYHFIEKVSNAPVKQNSRGQGESSHPLIQCLVSWRLRWICQINTCYVPVEQHTYYQLPRYVFFYFFFFNNAVSLGPPASIYDILGFFFFLERGFEFD